MPPPAHCHGRSAREEFYADELSRICKCLGPTMSPDEIGRIFPLDPRQEPALSTTRLAAPGSATGTFPVLCTGCRHFRPAGSNILSAEPACGAPGTAAGSDFQSYFQSRRLLLRARSSASCEFRLETGSPV